MLYIRVLRIIPISKKEIGITNIIKTAMSSNRTIIPGMEVPYSDSSSESQFGSNSITPNSVNPGGGTCVPNGIPNPSGEPTYKQASQKPVVGFLYSISRSGGGEYWPVYIGPNTIGRSSDCDICLPEGTVSDKHATLVVRLMRNPEKVIASICDSSSTIGTMINGESLGFEQKECFNGDIFTIGAHYDLLFILIDAKQIGLKVCGEFIPVNVQINPNLNFGGEQRGPNPTVDVPAGNPYAPPTNPSVRRTRGFNDDESMNSGSTQVMPDAGSSDNQEPPSGARTIFM